MHDNGRGEAAQDAGVEGEEGAAIRREDHDHIPHHRSGEHHRERLSESARKNVRERENREGDLTEALEV